MYSCVLLDGNEATISKLVKTAVGAVIQTWQVTRQRPLSNFLDEARRPPEVLSPNPDRMQGQEPASDRYRPARIGTSGPFDDCRTNNSCADYFAVYRKESEEFDREYTTLKIAAFVVRPIFRPTTNWLRILTTSPTQVLQKPFTTARAPQSRIHP